MAIVNKNFRVKNGLIVDGSVATVNGYNVLTEASTAFIINTIGGSADSANTPNAVVKRDGSGNFAAGTITATFSGNLTGDVTGTVSSLSNHNTGSLAEGSNLYFTNARALSATAAAYDAAGAASSAQANAATDATAKVAAEATARNLAIAAAIATEVTDRNAAIATAKSEAISDAATDATSKANADQAAAEATAASALTAAIATEVTNRNTAIGAAVDSLVDGAPALLDTLNELAAAINDDANYTTTITTALATKANSTDVATDIATAVSTAATDATNKVAAEATARNSAISTAISGEVTDRNSAIATAKTEAIADAATAANSALDDVKDGSTPFTAVNVNDVAAVKAATSAVASASTINALTWAAADYRTAKAIVKLKNGVNTQVSEVLLTLDTNNNVAITEFGTISTDLELGTVTAAYASGNVSIAVTTTYASTDVMVYATLIK
jgi:hypothetical protein